MQTQLDRSVWVKASFSILVILVRVFLRGMFYIMAQEKALASKVAQVFEFQSPYVGTAGKGKYYGSVKIDEIAVFRGVALAETDTVGIVTC